MGKLENSHRSVVIDVAKGIGMILVILLHIYSQEDALVLGYSFHMPLFFVISGYLFNKSKYTEFSAFFKKRIKTLVIPYMILYVFNVLCSFLLGMIKDGISLEMIKNHLHYLVNMILDPAGSGGMVYAPFWFVLTLLLTEVMYFFIAKLKSQWIIVGVCATMSGIGWLLDSGLIPFFPNRYTIWNFDSALFVLGFYALGNLFREQTTNIIERIQGHKHRILICVCLLMAFASICSFFAFWNGKVSIGSKILGNGILFYITGILGTIIVLLTSLLAEKSRLLAFCGQNSLYFMSFHCMVIQCVFLVYQKLGVTYDRTNIFQMIIPFVVVFTTTSLLTVAYKKVARRLSAIREKKECGKL